MRSTEEASVHALKKILARSPGASTGGFKGLNLAELRKYPPRLGLKFARLDGRSRRANLLSRLWPKGGGEGRWAFAITHGTDPATPWQRRETATAALELVKQLHAEKKPNIKIIDRTGLVVTVPDLGEALGKREYLIRARPPSNGERRQGGRGAAEGALKGLGYIVADAEHS